MGMFGWVSDPLDEMRSVAQSLSMTNPAEIDITVSEIDRTGFERRLRLIVRRNVTEEGKDESTRRSD